LRADDRALADLAASVADGQPVDWQHVEAKTGADRRLVRHLRLVENIASLYRSIPLEEPPFEAALPLPPEVMTAEPTGPRWGRLVMLDRIGTGTSSEVFRAWDTELHQEVALKLLHDSGDAPASEQRDRHARVLQEARRLARVRHPHVVQVYGAEEHDGRVGLWMELVRGESLEQIVRSRGTFGAAEASVIGQDLCAALAAVHTSGLLHRDIKAQNVLRESGGRTVLMDFGTGEELKNESGSARMAGTPLYVAPEVFGGKAATVQSDLYGLGVLLFYLLTGQFPVTAPSIEQLLRAHLQGQRRRLRDLRPDLPAPFVEVVERALNPDPARRYRTAGEMEAALREGAARFQSGTVAPEAWWRTLVRRPELASLYVAGLALLIALGAIVWSGRDGVSPRPATPGIRSIAVLPLDDVSSAPASPYFAEALTDQLIATLGQIKALKVASRTSVMQFKDSKTPIQQIFGSLGVDALLEGTVALVQTNDASRRVRVNTRLIYAGSDATVWSKTLERPIGDTLALEADLARQIADAVNATVSESESRRLTQVRATNPAAEEAYFQGRYHLGQFGVERAKRALQAFNRAVELDPTHAAALAGAARSYFNLGFAGAMSQQEARVSALSAVNRALTIDPEQGEAQVALGDLKFFYDWDWVAAESAYRKATEVNPSFSYARAQYARFLAAANRLEQAKEEVRTAAELDPLSADSAQSVGLILYYARDYDAAIRALEHAMNLDPGAARARYVLGRVFEAQGRADEAIRQTTLATQMVDDPGVSWRMHLIRQHAIAGRRGDAQAQFAAFMRYAEKRHLRIAPEHLAYFYLALGDEAAALRYLTRAVEERDPGVLWLAVDPRLDSLRDHPQFQKILSSLGLPRS
jgi:serine/threonine-protein kinase